MWPIHGKYICPQCLREYPVAWEGSPRVPIMPTPPCGLRTDSGSHGCVYLSVAVWLLSTTVCIRRL